MEKSGFFDAVETSPDVWDRSYLAEDFAGYFATFFANGVFPNPSTNLQVLQTEQSSMQVQLNVGKAYINGYIYENTAAKTFSIDVADGVLDRKDAIVIRWDKQERAIYSACIKGTPSVDAQAPTLTRTADYWDICVAIIHVNHGTARIDQSLIEDTRLNQELCGYVTGAISQVDTTTLYTQIQADLSKFQSMSQTEFDDWFEGIKGSLSEDPATALQQQINDILGGTTNVMIQEDYDADANGTVDDSERLGGQLPDYYGKADDTIQLYTYSGDTLTGTGTIGRFKSPISGTKTSFFVKGKQYSTKNGDEASIDLVLNGWYTFILDDTNNTINFKAGGGLSNSKLALATAVASDVVAGKTFYSGNKNLKTGTRNRSQGKYGSFKSLQNEDYTVSLGFKPSKIMFVYAYDGNTNTTILFDADTPDTYKLWSGSRVGITYNNTDSAIYGHIQRTQTGFKFKGYYTSSGNRTIQYMAVS